MLGPMAVAENMNNDSNNKMLLPSAPERLGGTAPAVYTDWSWGLLKV